MNLKYSKVSRRLDKVRPINGEYCFIFERTAGKLAPIRRQLGVLINFVNTICTEGNSLPVEGITRSRGLSDATHDSDETISIDVTPPPPPPPLSAPTQHRLGEFPPEPMEPPRPAPHTSTPLWKIALSDKYETENLFVGAEELAALEQTLQLAEDAKADIIRAELLCEQHCLFAHDMQEVFEEWIEKVNFWESRLRRRSDGDETELAWQELDEVQDQDQGYGSLKRKLSYEDSVWG